MSAQLKFAGLTTEGLACDYDVTQSDGMGASPVVVRISSSRASALRTTPIAQSEEIAKVLAEKLPAQWGFRPMPQFGAHAHEWWDNDRPATVDPSRLPHIDCSLEVPAPATQVWDIKIGNRAVSVETACSEVEQVFALLRE